MPIQHLNEFKAVLPTEEISLNAEIRGLLADKDPELLNAFKQGADAPLPEIIQHLESDLEEIKIYKQNPDFLPKTPLRDAQYLVNSYLSPQAIQSIFSDSIGSEQEQLPEYLNRFFEQLFITLNFWLSKEDNKVFFFQQKIELAAQLTQKDLAKRGKSLLYHELWEGDNQNKIIAMLLNAHEEHGGYLPNIPDRTKDAIINQIAGASASQQKRMELETVLNNAINKNFDKEIALKQKTMVMRIIYRIVRSRKLIGKIISEINSQPNNLANMAPNYLYDPKRRSKKDLYQVISAMLLPCLLEQYNLDSIDLNGFDNAPSAKIEILMFDKICEPLIKASDSLKRTIQKCLMLSGYYKITEKGGIKNISHTEFDVLTNISGYHTSDGQTIEYPAQGKNTNYAARNTLPGPFKILLLIPAALCWAYNRIQAGVRLFQRQFSCSANHAKAIARHTVGVAKRKTKGTLLTRLNKKNLRDDSFIRESVNRARIEEERQKEEQEAREETSPLLGSSSSDASDLSPKIQDQIGDLADRFEEHINPNTLRGAPTPTHPFQDYRSASPNCVTPET